MARTSASTSWSENRQMTGSGWRPPLRSAQSPVPPFARATSPHVEFPLVLPACTLRGQSTQGARGRMSTRLPEPKTQATRPAPSSSSGLDGHSHAGPSPRQGLSQVLLCHLGTSAEPPSPAMPGTRGPPRPSPHPGASLEPQRATYFPASRPRRPGGTWSRRGRRWPRCPPRH